ncbi:MAG: hypothetical protein POELPBGB_03306 [Bacteroidia bacterium]|nr:hypothetical protein [Bacteroidia bacterium]
MEKVQNQQLSNRPVFIGLAVFISLLALTQYLSYQRYIINSTAEQRDIANAAITAKERLQTALSHSIATTKTLGFIIEKYGVPKKFDDIAKPFILSNEYIDAVQLVKKGVITEIYPIKGNEAAIGYNIFSDPVQKKAAQQAIEKKQFFLYGPLELQQGGWGILIRQPVFIKHKFWGFAASLIKLPRLMKTAGVDNQANSDYLFALSKINPADGKEMFFWGEKTTTGKNYSETLLMPNGEWKIYVHSKKPGKTWLTVTFVLFGISLSLLGGLFAWYFARQPENLKAQVEEKTKQIKEGEINYRNTLGRVSDAIVGIDQNWRYTFMNDAALANHPQGREATMGKIIWDVHPEMEGTVFQKKYIEAMETGKPQEVESYYPPMDTWFSVKVYPSSDGLTIFYKDITQTKKSEEQLRKEKELSDSVINSLPGIFYLYDETGKFLRWNKNFETVSGYTAEEIARMHPLDFFDDDEKQLLTEKILSVFKGGKDDVEASFFTKERKKIPYYFNGWVTQYEGKTCLLGVGIDITERKKTEKELLISNERFGISSKATNNIIWDWDLKTDLVYWNDNFYLYFGYEKGKISPYISFWDDRLHPDDKDRVSNNIRKAIEKHENFWTDEYRFLDSRNNVFYIYDRGYIMYDNQGKPTRMVGAMIDITERKIAEQKILKTSRLYYFISRVNQTLIHASDEKKLYSEVCRIAVEQGNFRMAWIGLVDEQSNKVVPVMHAGEENGYLSHIKPISVADIPEGQGPTGTALREGHYICCNDIENDPHMLAWKNEALSRGYRSSISLPIKKFGKVIGAFNLYSAQVSFFDEQEIKLLLETTANISFAIENFEKERMRKHATEELVKSREELRSLSAHLQSIREEERTNIAREIHDELGQQLTGLKMDIAWIKNKSEKEFQFPLLREKTNDMIDLVNHSIASVRRIAKELRPGILDDLGLEAAIEWQAKEFEERTGIKCEVESLVEGKNYSKDINTAVFRIFQESLTNVARHSGANTVLARIYEQNHTLFLEVIDNGKGITEERKHNRSSLGLLGMTERAANLGGIFSIENHVQGGTIVTVQIPLHAL